MDLHKVKIYAASGVGVLTLCSLSFLAGRKTVKPNIEIQYKEHTIYQEDVKKEEQVIADKVKTQVKQIVEQKEKELQETYKKKMNSENKGKITIVTTTTTDKDGKKVVTQTKTIDYDSKKNTNTNKNTHRKDTDNKKTDTKIDEKKHTEDTKKEEDHTKIDKRIEEKVKEIYPNTGNGVAYTFLIGRSFSDPAIDYMGQVGIPLPFFSFIKLDVGYEWIDKRMFVGSTVIF